MDRKSYLRYYPLLTLLMFFLVIGLPAVILYMEKEDEKCWLVTARVAAGSISQEELSAMTGFSGLETLWPVVQENVRLSLNGYFASVTLNGVDLQSYPLSVICSAGRKQQGDTPLLVLGEEALQSLQDQQGHPMGERQQALLMQELAEQKLYLLPAEAETDPDESPEQTQGEEGEILALTKGDGGYMDRNQMERWLKRQGKTPVIRAAHLQIRGKEAALLAQTTLEKAGYEVYLSGPCFRK